MVKIIRRGTVQRVFENLKKISKITEFKILVHHHFLRLCLLCIVKKLDSIRTKLTEEIDFEVFPHGDAGNGTAVAARCWAG